MGRRMMPPYKCLTHHHPKLFSVGLPPLTTSHNHGTNFLPSPPSTHNVFPWTTTWKGMLVLFLCAVVPSFFFDQGAFSILEDWRREPRFQGQRHRALSTAASKRALVGVRVALGLETCVMLPLRSKGGARLSPLLLLLLLLFSTNPLDSRRGSWRAGPHPQLNVRHATRPYSSTHSTRNRRSRARDAQ